MEVSWPAQAGDWPTQLHEHATHLTRYLGETLKCIDREKDRAVPPDLVRTIIRGMFSLLVKVQKAPDLTTLHNTVRTMHTDAKTTAEENKRAIEAIRKELKSTAVDISKSITIGEEAKAIAKEAADVSKVVAGITRDIKNKGVQPQAGTPTSYAAVAAHGALAAGTYNAQSVKMPPVQTLREIIVNIRSPHTTQSLRAMNPRSLKAHIEQAIAQSENEHITNVKIMSTNQLKSGDLSIKTTTNNEMQALRQFTDDWVHRIGSNVSVRNPTFGVLVHGIRVSTMNTDNFEDTRDTILQDNKPFIPTADIKYIGWLTGKPPNKRMSSVIIEFTRPEDANKIIDEGLVWQGEVCQCERYERQCRLKQCFNCQKYGHIGTQCKATTACGYCAQEHNTRDCPSKTDRELPRKCANCRGSHEAWNRECPNRMDEKARTRVAHDNRMKYHPATGVGEPAGRPGFLGDIVRRRRSARDISASQHARGSRPSSPVGRGQKRTAPTDKENEHPTGSQRPQRAITRTRKALETLESITVAGPQMEIDDDSDS